MDDDYGKTIYSKSIGPAEVQTWSWQDPDPDGERSVRIFVSTNGFEGKPFTPSQAREMAAALLEAADAAERVARLVMDVNARTAPGRTDSPPRAVG